MPSWLKNIDFSQPTNRDLRQSKTVDNVVKLKSIDQLMNDLRMYHRAKSEIRHERLAYDQEVETKRQEYDDLNEQTNWHIKTAQDQIVQRLEELAAEFPDIVKIKSTDSSITLEFQDVNTHPDILDVKIGTPPPLNK